MSMRLLLDKLSRLYPKSLVGEFYRIFGAEVTEKLLTVFGGTTIRVPTTKDLQEAQRNLAIYDTLIRSTTSKESRRLSTQLSNRYDVTKKEIRVIFRHMKRLNKESSKIKEADVAVGKHRKKKLRLRKKSRRRWKV